MWENERGERGREEEIEKKGREREMGTVERIADRIRAIRSFTSSTSL